MAKPRFRAKIEGVIPPPTFRQILPPNKTEQPKTKYKRKREKKVETEE